MLTVRQKTERAVSVTTGLVPHKWVQPVNSPSSCYCTLCDAEQASNSDLLYPISPHNAKSKPAKVSVEP
jgi:hypothetical protein